MNLTELKPDLWTQEAIPTEYSAFKLLRDNPVRANTHYLAAPWSVLLNTRPQFFNNSQKPKTKNGFTICQHISYAKIIPYLKQCGITTLFTPHASKNHSSITILPFPHHAVNGVNPANKDIFCSFVGCLITHATRKIIWNTRPNQSDVKIIRRHAWHYEGTDRLNHEIEYKNILARSRFSLCPRGTGASTIRFWESLQAGAIPILISDAMRLPLGWDWHQTIIRLPESDTSKWPQITKDITPKHEKIMRQNCLKAFKCFSGKNLVSNIRLFFET